MKAKDVMRPTDTALRADDTVRQALQELEKSRHDRLMVVDGDQIVGHLSSEQADEIDRRAPNLQKEMVGNIMDANMKTCRPDDLLDDLLDIFRRSLIDVIAVIDRRQNLCGWIAREDLLPTDGSNRMH